MKLEVSCDHLEVRGVRDKYKPNSDGLLEVGGLTLMPNAAGKVHYGRDHSIKVTVVGIDFVRFPVRIRAGKPQLR